jgi:peptide/nickel transport system substrate-binding protein
VTRSLLLGALIALIAAAGCTRRSPDTGPIDVSTIGPLETTIDPDRKPLSPGEEMLIDATAQGLVTIDAAGQIEPALAERWIVTDDGLGYIFRLRDARWRDGRRITSDAFARLLRAAIKPSSRNALRPALSALAEISAVTPDVIDIRLKRPLPGFLTLLARPELTLRRAGDGTGPYRVVKREVDRAVLEDRASPAKLPRVTLHGERAARAIIRFKLGQVDLVSGGTIGSLPPVREAGLAVPSLRFDPVRGLYGLAITDDGGALADPVLRRALMMALDGNALVARAELPGLTPPTGLVPADLGDFAAPARPDWLALPLEQRQALAAATIRAWGNDHDGPPKITISRPAAVGDQLMVKLAAAQWRAIGVEVTLVDPDAPAILRLVDEIAPVASADWYRNHFTCKATSACSPVADAALASAGGGTLHAALTGEAARLMTEQAPFFPLANPVRWSLVAPGLDGYRDNPLALHPLARLRAPASQ